MLSASLPSEPYRSSAHIHHQIRSIIRRSSVAGAEDYKTVTLLKDAVKVEGDKPLEERVFTIQHVLCRTRKVRTHATTLGSFPERRQQAYESVHEANDACCCELSLCRIIRGHSAEHSERAA